MDKLKNFQYEAERMHTELLMFKYHPNIFSCILAVYFIFFSNFIVPSLVPISPRMTEAVDFLISASQIRTVITES